MVRKDEWLVVKIDGSYQGTASAVPEVAPNEFRLQPPRWDTLPLSFPATCSARIAPKARSLKQEPKVWVGCGEL